MILWYNIAYIWMYCTTRCTFYGTYKLVMANKTIVTIL